MKIQMKTKKREMNIKLRKRRKENLDLIKGNKESKNYLKKERTMVTGCLEVKECKCENIHMWKFQESKFVNGFSHNSQWDDAKTFHQQNNRSAKIGF